MYIYMYIYLYVSYICICRDTLTDIVGHLKCEAAICLQKLMDMASVLETIFGTIQHYQRDWHVHYKGSLDKASITDRLSSIYTYLQYKLRLTQVIPQGPTPVARPSCRKF